MRCACIDIGSNTTRLLVAEPGTGGLREVLAERVFTGLGAGFRGDGSISAEKIAEVAAVVAAQTRRARDAGAGAIRVVATAAVRVAPNGSVLVAAIAEACGAQTAVLSGEQEARLAFAGATAALFDAPAGALAVADVGGGSSELVVGSLAHGVRWYASLPIGSGQLAELHLRSDPPTVDEIDAVRAHVREALRGLTPPAASAGYAVGGSATSLARLVGDVLEPPALERALGVLASTPIAAVAEVNGLDPRRVRLLPAGIVLLEQAAELLGVPLRIATGGVREGVILELLGRV